LLDSYMVGPYRLAEITGGEDAPVQFWTAGSTGRNAKTRPRIGFGSGDGDWFFGSRFVLGYTRSNEFTTFVN